MRSHVRRRVVCLVKASKEAGQLHSPAPLPSSMVLSPGPRVPASSGPSTSTGRAPARCRCPSCLTSGGAAGPISRLLFSSNEQHPSPSPVPWRVGVSPTALSRESPPVARPSHPDLGRARPGQVQFFGLRGSRGQSVTGESAFLTEESSLFPKVLEGLFNVDPPW